MRGRGRILITPRSLTSAGVDTVAELEPLRRAQFELVAAPAGEVPDPAELTSLLSTGEVVGWLAGVERISADVLESASSLRIIARNGVGADSIDLEAAKRCGIEVRTAPGANAQGVAELAVAHGLSLLRSIPQGNSALRDGRWDRSKGREIGDICVGIVGYGAIGRRVADLFTALGASVAFHDPFATGLFQHESVSDLDLLLSRSDLLSLHVPPSPDGPMLDAKRVGLLPKGAIVVNTARAALVDPIAMHRALDSGAISGYAIDAFDQEPPELDALLSHPRTVMTPHVGGFTDSSVRRATEAAVAQLLDVLG
ncbi:oxidoreductase [Brachybacterium vulturis]|uniref:Oxidoreductase n=1 Tax=Brachybacterium vulturis TaxID=2017484 RepID=A0A291GPE0_9MICO|nr:NAD(P)-dependent oxidoreductase [Brachybacterium vulturis]ATG52111.1 oxidoreductase [Brachybacterium vulturis]